MNEPRAALGWTQSEDGTWKAPESVSRTVPELSQEDVPPSPGWWLASDGKWYAPELHPDYQAQSVTVERNEDASGQMHSDEGESAPTVTIEAPRSGMTRTEMVRDAIDKWRRQLIDLGGRNNLLYYKDRVTATLDLSPDLGDRNGHPIPMPVSE